ncbi:MAG: mechanosensitive ion channel [Gammaproteobacteria bacterium]|nr:mechanosensitive ion channel [Gammaproteobacteria bacterium]
MGFFDTLRESFLDPMLIWGKIASVLPSLIAAIVLLVAGHFIGKFLAHIIAKLLAKVGLDKLGEKAGLGDAVAGSGIVASPSMILGKIIYWLIFLTFIISAADTLGLQRVSDMIGDFVLYLPKVIGAILVALIGLFVASLVRTGVEAGLASVNLGYEKAIGGLIYAIIVIVVISLAIGQLEVETALFNQVISIVLLAAAAAVALALGLGTRDVAGNIVAGVYARDLYQPGATIRFGDLSGKILEVGSTSVVIRVSADKTITVPNRRLLDEQVEIITEA